MQRGPAAIICLLLLALLLVVIYRTPWPSAAPDVGPTAQPIGRLLMTDYLLPFEVISVLLFAVLVGAALIARREVRR
jgi:NADH:ubiquinone oxidoreductase subunit 6 (subunit J)